MSSRDHVDFQGGYFQGTVIGKADYHQSAAAPTALDALPARTAGFTGRDGELTRLLEALDPTASAGAPKAVLVTAVSGLGGVGKTALTVEAAYAARAEGWFPGGALFLDMHGYDDVPVTADQALQSLLRALGVQPEHIPATADERAVLYRSLLAERASRRGSVLILVDNASSPEQVRPLLPGGAVHRVLITSRDRLPQLGARLVPLDQLTPEDAGELLDVALRIAEPQDSRIRDDADAAERLAALCGYLPLALQIAVALLAEDRDMPVAELVGELAESRDRLGHLDDGERSVRAAFDLSYRRLPPGPARLLRLLALAPGPEASPVVIDTLAVGGTPAARDLKILARAHLVERGSRRGWWRLHDLVRVFGAGLSAAPDVWEEGEKARGFVLVYYLLTAGAADEWLRWLPGDPVPERFENRAQALAWLDAERAGLLEAVQWGREEQHAQAAGWLGRCLMMYLSWRRYFEDLYAVATVAQEVAHCAGSHHDEALAWDSIGNALRATGRVEEAIDALTRARALYQVAGNRKGEAGVWDHLGLALTKAGRVDDAMDAFFQADDLYEALGDVHGQAFVWEHFGNLASVAGCADEAIEALTHACDLYQATEERHGQGSAWNNLGATLCEAGRPEDAVAAFRSAVEAFKEAEDWYMAGKALQNLAVAPHVPGWSAHIDPVLLRAGTFLGLMEASFAYDRADAFAEAARARAWARAYFDAPAATAPPPPPAPTDKPAPASRPARKPASVQPSPPPPNAPDTAEP